MRNIAVRNMLMRCGIELPKGMKLERDEFRDGWEFVRTLDARRLEKKIVLCGWNFIRIADRSLRSGVGETSQEAIASALKLALRRVSTHFNVAEVEHIELTQYPWFFLARVRVNSFRIQQSAVMPVPDESLSAPIVPRLRRLPANAEVLYPYFGSCIPQLKEMLVISRTSQARTQ